MKRIIQTDKAPSAVGPYSQATAHGEFLFLSGQVGIDPETGMLVEGVEAQTYRVMKNLVAVLEEAGSDLSKVLKVTIYVTDLANFKLLNDIYGSYFDCDPPARATVQVAALPLGAEVEMDMIAYR